MILSKALTTTEYMHVTLLQNPDDTVTRIIVKPFLLRYFHESTPYPLSVAIYIYKSQNVVLNSTVRSLTALKNPDACHACAASEDSDQRNSQDTLL
jgi:hypothetical protein